MLSNLCTGELYLGLGRGTAKMEYDAFDIDMEEARDRYRECLDVLQLGLSGETFEYAGEHVALRRAARIRPTPVAERVHLFGAVGSVPSAPLMADLGLAPLNICQFPTHILEKIMTDWTARAEEVGFPDEVRRPVVAHCLMAETDDAAFALARRHLSEFFALQSKHYEADLDAWADIKGYEQFSRYFENLKRLAEPENIDEFAAQNLVGSSATVARRVEELAAIGFNHIVIHPATLGIPRAIRHDTLAHFATTVAPEFSATFRPAAVAE